MRDEWRTFYKLRAATASFRRRVSVAEDVLKRWLRESKRPYVGWSGGKDSTCLLILLSRLGRTDVPLFTQCDDLDWPEKRQHCIDLATRLGFLHHELRDSEVSAADQFARANPGDEIVGTFSHVIEGFERDYIPDGVALGIRAEESKNRRRLACRGELWQDARRIWRCMPLLHWRGEDVFALIVSAGVPYMPLYNGIERAPHEWRMSWPATPAYWASGGAAELRRNFPQHFARLATLNPRLREYV